MATQLSLLAALDDTKVITSKTQLNTATVRINGTELKGLNLFKHLISSLKVSCFDVFLTQLNL